MLGFMTQSEAATGGRVSPFLLFPPPLFSSSLEVAEGGIVQGLIVWQVNQFCHIYLVVNGPVVIQGHS